MNQLKPGTFEYYKQSSIRGVRWTGGAEIFSRLFQFAVNVLLARLLMPSDFGKIALALVVVKFIQLVIDFGVSSTLIQRRRVSADHYHTSFTLVVLFSLFFALGVFLESDLVASILGNVEISQVIKYLSIVVILNGINVLPRAYLTRKLNFRRIVAAEFISTLFYGISTVIAAYILRNLWCFVIGLIVEQVVLGVFLWSFYGKLPRLSISYQAFKDLLNFSSFVFGTRLTNFFNLSILNILINKFFGSYALGIFSLSYQIVDLPTQRIAKNIMKVMYPILSKLQHSLAEYEKMILNSIFLILVIILPFFAVLFLLAEPFVLLFFGEKWISTVPFLKILCVAGLVRSLWTVVSVISMSIGKPQFELFLNLGNGLFLITGIVLLSPLGMQIIVLYFTLLLAIFYCYGQYRVFRWINFAPARVISELRGTILSNFILFASILALTQFQLLDFIPQVSFKFVLLSILSLIIYFWGLYFLDREGISNLVKLIFKKES